tara:strand:- start:281 stop:496 length:216 start_codon:yes stop_codon:yes gene_type:complete
MITPAVLLLPLEFSAIGCLTLVEGYTMIKKLELNPLTVMSEFLHPFTFGPIPDFLFLLDRIKSYRWVLQLF